MPGRATSRREVIGGRWAVSWQGYVLLIPLAIPLSLLVVPAFFEPGTWPQGLALASFAYLVAGAVLALASMTVLRRRRQTPAPVWLVFVVGGLAWLMRSAVFAAYLQMTGEPHDAPVWQRLAVGFLLGGLLVTGVALLLGIIDDFRAERRRLLDLLVRQELAAERSAAYVSLMSEQLLSRVNEQVRHAADHVQANTAQDAPDEDLLREAVAVEAAVRRTSKELSTSLWAQAREDSRVPFHAVLRATARRPFTLWPIPFFVLFAVAYLGRFTPLGATIVTVIAAAAWAVAITVAGNALCSRTARPSVILYLILLLLLAVGSATLAGAMLDLTVVHTVGTLQLMLALSLPLTVLMIAGGIAHGVDVAEDGVLEDVESSITEAEVRAKVLAIEEGRLRRELALHLHGTVAANVTASVMRLRQALDAHDIDAAKQSLTEARSQLQSNLGTTALIDSSDLEGLLASIADSWRGLADVRIELGPHDHLPAHTVRSIVDVVTEAVSNAVRHGDAGHVDIGVTVTDRHVHIESRDDGVRDGSRTEGLGSTLFSDVAGDGWELSALPDGGHLLIVDIPADPPRVSPPTTP